MVGVRYALVLSALMRMIHTHPVSQNRFSITFLTAIMSSLAIAVYSSVSKKLRLPTTLSFLSFVIFNGTNILAISLIQSHER
jgi:drug/metabolite transporter (DMT)-like permease